MLGLGGQTGNHLVGGQLRNPVNLSWGKVTPRASGTVYTRRPLIALLPRRSHFAGRTGRTRYPLRPGGSAQSVQMVFNKKVGNG